MGASDPLLPHSHRSIRAMAHGYYNRANCVLDQAATGDIGLFVPAALTQAGQSGLPRMAQLNLHNGEPNSSDLARTNAQAV
jgi:hypothetical protein